MLHQENPYCVLVVKRLSRLGYRSVSVIREYLTQFGEVKKIILLPCRSSEGHRPSSMCFVLMDSRKSAERVLIWTYRHSVADVEVDVVPYIPLPVDSLISVE